jgi:hypothetical protein
MENSDNYLAILSGQQLENLLSPGEKEAVTGGLWTLLAGRVESYQRGTSDSIRVEAAKELLKSACFVVSQCLKAQSPEDIRALLLRGAYDDLFRAGLEALEDRMTEGRALLRRAADTAVRVSNRAYRESYRELSGFFKRYHIHHFAHEIPCVLTYPLAWPVEESLLGIDYIMEYQRRLVLENEFTGRFEAAAITALLRSISPAFREDLLSIYEAVAANAVALTLLEGDVRSLDVSDRDRVRLTALFSRWSDAEAPEKLRRAARELYNGLGLQETKGPDGEGDKPVSEPAADYLADTAAAFWPRIKVYLSDGLKNVFPPLYRETAPMTPAPRYVDNAVMDNEALRALIDELTSCRHLSDKLALVKAAVTSVRDLMEILNTCFWEAEIPALLDALGPEACRILESTVRERRRRAPDWRSETGWEKRLGAYTAP